MTSAKQIETISNLIQIKNDRFKDEIRFLKIQLLITLIIILFLILGAFLPRILFMLSPNGKEYVNTIIIDNYLSLKIDFPVGVMIFLFYFKQLKTILEFIKYYQNETTNLEARYTAIKFAIIRNDTKTISELLLLLMQTERNYVLKEGESTVEIENRKITQIEDKTTVDTINSVF